MLLKTLSCLKCTFFLLWYHTKCYLIKWDSVSSQWWEYILFNGTILHPYEAVNLTWHDCSFYIRDCQQIGNTTELSCGSKSALSENSSKNHRTLSAQALRCQNTCNGGRFELLHNFPVPVTEFEERNTALSTKMKVPDWTSYKDHHRNVYIKCFVSNA